MRLSRLSLLLGGAALMASAAQAQQYMMVPESSNDRVMLFNASDGSIVNLDFIVDAGGTPYDFSTPKDAIQVGSEIWVFDQLTDQIVRRLRPGENVLSCEVANTWHNRLVGDSGLPPAERITRTNIRGPFGPDTALLESGLRGPVRLVPVERGPGE
jgi:hypothetical protein